MLLAGSKGIRRAEVCVSKKKEDATTQLQPGPQNLKLIRRHKTTRNRSFIELDVVESINSDPVADLFPFNRDLQELSLFVYVQIDCEWFASRSCERICGYF